MSVFQRGAAAAAVTALLFTSAARAQPTIPKRIPRQASVTLQRLIEQLYSDDATVRQAAVKKIGTMTPRISMFAIPFLVSMLGDEPAVREEASKALLKMWRPIAGRELARALGGENETARELAAKTLVRMGAAGGEALSDALGEGSPKDITVGRRAAEVLAGMGKTGEDWLIAAVDNRQLAARGLAITTLKKKGKFNKSRMTRALSASHPKVRCAAVCALGTFKDKKTSKYLLKGLNDAHRFVRTTAAWSAGEVKDKRLVKSLVKALSDRFGIVRAGAARARGGVGGGA